jgi:hypothetical protein
MPAPLGPIPQPKKKKQKKKKKKKKTNEMCCLERKKIYFLFFPSCTKFGIIDIFLAKNERKKINANYWERKYLVRV